MSQLLVQQYLNEIDRLRKFSGSTTEQVIREAFKDLLKNWARQQNLHFVPELEYQTSLKTKVYPDGTVLHDLRVPLGYWEAKDTADDLDAEIAKKFTKGYPQDNIIFENSDTAVLIQNRQEVTRCSMTDTDALLRLVSLFFGYERAEIRDFRKAVEQFRHDIPAVLAALRERIDAAYGTMPDFRAAAEKFLQHARDTINPAVGEADVREMLIQHILTEEIFAHVFNDSQFHRENNIAKELYALEAKFFTGATRRETLKGLETYYATIRSNAALISSHQEKQQFLKLIYENFYKVYNPKAADRLGVVYTPNEIVKFMVEGADWLVQKHFGRKLIDEHVEILDPATGTGTFICELMEHFRGQPQKLAHKYKNELHANEVAILPYYVANLNIEATYAAISGQFAEYPNLCFVDTLDNVFALGVKTGQHVGDLFGAMSEENVARVKRQNAKKISVIIGNPPYNANQANENDNNKNHAYEHIDKLIKSSYIRLSTAQKTKVYDMYARFFRWASDRLADDGVLAFITNRSFIDSRTFDGFRRAVAGEFNEIHVVDLGGDVRANPKLSGTKHNVFGIQTGVAISFFVKRNKQKGCKIFYARRPEFDTADDKLSYLASTPLSGVAFERVEPDKNANWINLTENDWDGLIPVADKKTKAAKSKGQEKAIFRLFASGVKTNRDEWVYAFDRQTLLEQIDFLIERFNQQLLAGTGDDDALDYSIKWSSGLKARKKGFQLDTGRIRSSLWRPYTEKSFYSEKLLSDRMTELHFRVWGADLKSGNVEISISGTSSAKPFQTLAVSGLTDYEAIEKSNLLPRYRYTAAGERIDNITDWALKEFQKAYGKDGRGRPGADGDAATSPLRGGRTEGPGGGSSSSAGASDTPTPNPSPQGGGGLSTDAGAAPHPASPGKPGSAFPLPVNGERATASPPRTLSKDAIFHYVYGVLHDPLYREKYALNLKREFPRMPFYPDFWRWADWGEALMALHIGYETVEPWPLTRTDTADENARKAGVSPKALLRADREGGVIRLDSETVLSGIPAEAWEYRLGNRSGLDWVLDQYKEKTPKDPTIREKFNTYRFADYKEKVVDLLCRVTRVSVETVAITEAMKAARR